MAGKEVERGEHLLSVPALRHRYRLARWMVADVGEPDSWRPNPNDPNDPTLPLYRQERIERWIEAHKDVYYPHVRRVRAQQQEERIQTMAWAWTVPLRIERLPDCQKLSVEAVLYFFQHGSVYDPRDTKFGIFSYVRHAYTNYDELCALLPHNKTVRKDVYTLLRRRVDAMTLRHLQGEYIPRIGC